jgi:hypothetical protein
VTPSRLLEAAERLEEPMVPHGSVVREAAALLREAHELLREVSNSGVSFQDPRVGYLEVQINRATWESLRSLLGSDG